MANAITSLLGIGGGQGAYAGSVATGTPNMGQAVQPASGGMGSTLGSLASSALPIGMMVASNYFQGQQAKKAAERAQAQSLSTWQQNAYPQQSVVNAAAKENRGQLGQARLGSYQNMASNLASRGWGSGSGLMAGGAQNIERGYLQALGKQSTDMTKFANTPMFGMPQQAYSSPVSGGVEQGLQGLDYALGQMQAAQLLKALYGGQ